MSDFSLVSRFVRSALAKTTWSAVAAHKDRVEDRAKPEVHLLVHLLAAEVVRE